MIRLPVCGIGVLLRPPNGADEVALNEADCAALPAALQLLERLAVQSDGSAGNWTRLIVTDFEILMLRLRAMLLGGNISSHVTCPNCRERVEISFRIDDYIAAVRPVAPTAIVPAPLEGWLTLAGATFRLPTVADLLAVQHTDRPGAALRARCLAPGTAGPVTRRIENAIARLAPQVSGDVGGACPECGTALQAWFDVVPYVITELRRRAAGVYAQVHLLATAYGWEEGAILALPEPRRRCYAALVDEDRGHRALVA